MAGNINPSFFTPSSDVMRSVLANTGELANQKSAVVNKQDEDPDSFRASERHMEPGMHVERSEAPAQEIKHEDIHPVVPKQPDDGMNDEDRQRLRELDSGDHAARHLNSDLNPEQVAAARRVLQSQKDKVDKKLKYGPEAEAAIKPELKPSPLQSAMDILEPTADKMGLLSEEDMDPFSRR